MTSTEAIKRGLLKGKGKPLVKGPMLSTGSTVLNLACTGTIDGGFPTGSYVLFVGDSNSGKSWFGHSCLAEATIDKRFDDYRLIYDDVEGGSRMDVERFFGKRLAERIEPPAIDEEGRLVYSEKAEEFYYHVDDAIKVGKPFVYVLDSQDALSSRTECEKFDEVKVAYREGKQVTGSYGDAKAKVHSANIRKLLGPLERSGSILIILNQTRDSYEMFKKKTYSGGWAIWFYATMRLWGTVGKKVERTVKGKKRQLGVNCRIRVERSRITGWDRTAMVHILHSCGIDDVGGCIDYLIDEGYWKERKGVITATGMGPTVEARREKLVGLIEDRGSEQDLRELVGMVWGEIEKACVVERKKRYA